MFGAAFSAAPVLPSLATEIALKAWHCRERPGKPPHTHDLLELFDSSGPRAAHVASFKWINTTLGNIKSAITGTYRKLGPDHAERYLASFAWRYNRRYRLKTMIPRFVHSAARTRPMPHRSLIAG